MLKINRNKEMQNKIYHRIIIGSFLILGTLLALCLTVYEGYDLFWIHNTWMYRDGLLAKICVVGIYANIVLLFFAGLTSTVSFFRMGHIWKPITKGIIINIVLWLILAGLMFCLFPVNFLAKICGLLITGLFAWMMLQIWKMIRIQP